MKRLLLCSNAVPWPDRPHLGGFHVLQARALQELGHDMELFGPGPRVPKLAGRWVPRLRSHAARPDRYVVDGVTIHAPKVPFAFPGVVRRLGAEWAPALLSGAAARAYRGALERVLDGGRYDGLVVHGAFPMGRLVGEVAAARGLPWAVIEHSADDVMRLEPGTALGREYLRWVADARRVFAVGPHMVERLQRLGVEQAAFLPNGADLAEVTDDDPRPDDLRGCEVILAAAQYYRRKGLEELVEGFAEIAEAHPRAVLVLVTNAPEDLRRRAELSGAGDRVRFLPLLRREALLGWMRRARLFALPSWSEAFGLVYVEALGQGTPVLLTHDSGVGRLLEPVERGGPAWMVRPRDPGAIADALDDVLTHPRAAEAAGARGRALVEERFTWRGNAQALLAGLERAG